MNVKRVANINHQKGTRVKGNYSGALTHQL